MLALDVAAFAALQAKSLADLGADLRRVHAQRYPDLGRLFAHDRSYPEHHLAQRYLEAQASEPRFPVWPPATDRPPRPRSGSLRRPDKTRVRSGAAVARAMRACRICSPS